MSSPPYIPKYFDKEALLELIKLQRPSATDRLMPDALMLMSDAFIDRMLVQNKLHPSKYLEYLASECSNLLKSASLCAALELCCYNGIIQWATGDLALEDLGGIARKFQPYQPMFFFAQGMVLGFYDLLSHETWRLMLNQLIKRFYDCYTRFNEDGSYNHVLGRISYDWTSRGYGWNRRDSYREAADLESEG